MYLDGRVIMYAISFMGALLVLTHAVVKLRCRCLRSTAVAAQCAVESWSAFFFS